MSTYATLEPMRRYRRYLLLAPSAVLGLLALVWLQFYPFPYEVGFGPFGLLLITALLVTALLGGAWLFAKLLPSFRYAERLMERALLGIRLSLPIIFILAAASSLAEELFFRGALLPLVGVWGQALLFGLLHPATRKGWGYTLFTFIAGVMFGYATLISGSLWPAILAHFVINARGFWELRQRRKPLRQVVDSRT